MTTLEMFNAYPVGERFNYLGRLMCVAGYGTELLGDWIECDYVDSRGVIHTAKFDCIQMQAILDANARLIEVAPDYHYWAKRFTAKIKNFPKDQELPAWVFILGNELKVIVAKVEETE